MKEIREKKEEYEDQVEGRNAVLELLESTRDINKIFIENKSKMEKRRKRKKPKSQKKSSHQSNN